MKISDYYSVGSVWLSARSDHNWNPRREVIVIGVDVKENGNIFKLEIENCTTGKVTKIRPSTLANKGWLYKGHVSTMSRRVV